MSNELELSKSLAYWDRALKVMPGGVNASARMNGALQHPIVMDHANGAYLWTADGQRLIDYCISHGGSLLGHGNPAVVAAVAEAMARGVMLSYETDIQIDVAERLIALFPGMQMVRYACSGTETTWHALRVARAFTGKWRVVKFEGHYHGVNDTVGYSHWPELDKASPADAPVPVPDSAGIPPANDALITMLPFNDVAAFERCLDAQGDEIAAVIMEPINFDSCGLVPSDAFLDAVRTLTRKKGIVLVFDEVLSGFRVRRGGALGERCIPDMTVLGKAVGGGMPVSAFMGTAEIMNTCTPVGPALNSGTYNAPPVLVSAIGAMLDVTADPGFYPHLEAVGTKLYSGMREILERRGVKAWVQGVGARFGLLFGLNEEPRNYRDVAKQDLDAMRRFHVALLRRGVYMHNPSPHHGFSIAHSLADVDETLDAMDEAIQEV